MNEDVQNTEYEVVSDNNQFVQYTSEDETDVVYQEVVDESDMYQNEDSYEDENVNNNESNVRTFTDENGIVYYKYDDNNDTQNNTYEDDSNVEYEEIVIEDGDSGYQDLVNDSDEIEYQEVVYEEIPIDSDTEIPDSFENNESSEEVVYIESEDESEEFVLGENGPNDTVSEDVKNNDNISDSNVENKNVITNGSDSKTKSEGKSVFTQEEKDSLVSDEAIRSISVVAKLPPTLDSQISTGQAKNNSVVKLNSSNVQQNQVMVTGQNVSASQGQQVVQQPRTNMNQVAVPVAQAMNSYQVQGQQVVQQPQVNMNQVAVPVAQTMVPYQVQGQQVVQQPQANMNQVAVPVAQTMVPYQVQGQQVVQQPQANMNQVAVPVAQTVNSYQGQGQSIVQQPQANSMQLGVGQSQMVNSGSINNGYPAPTYQPGVQQTMGQANTPLMYQANSATYAARGVPQMNQGVYQNTGATQVVGTNASPTISNRPASPATKPINSKSVKKKKFSFFKFFFFLLIIAVVAIFVYLIYFRESNYTGSANLNSVLDPLKPIIMYMDDKVGYIDYKGEIIISPTYDEGTEFYGGYAAVLSNDEYKIINKKEEVIVTAKTNQLPIYDVDYDVWIIDGALYNGKLEQLITDIEEVGNGFYLYNNSSSSTVGVVNHKGEILYSGSGTSIDIEVSKVYDDDVYALVHIPNSDDVIVSSKTKDVIYTSSANTISNQQDAIFLTQVNGVNKFLYFNNGKLVKEFDNVTNVSMYNSKKGILEISKDGSKYYFDTINGTELDNASYDLSFGTQDEKYYGYEEIECGEGIDLKYGLAKGDETIFSCEYDSIDFLDIEVHEFIKRRTLKEVVLLSKGDVTQVYDLTFKKTLLELENVVTSVSSYSPFIIFSADEDSSTNEDVVYSILTNKKVSFTAKDKYFISGSNYIAALDEDNNASYYNIKLDNIYVGSSFLQ